MSGSEKPEDSGKGSHEGSGEAPELRIKEILDHLQDATEREPPPDLEAGEGAKEEEESIFPSDEDRYREKKDLIHRLFLGGLRVGAGLVALVVLVRLFHLLSPFSWRWLSDGQLATIDNVLLGGGSVIIGAVAARYFDDVL